MYNRILLPVLFVLLLAGTVVAKEKVAVFEFEGIGIDRSTIEAGTRIFGNELNATGKFMVIPQGDVETILSQRGISNSECFQVSCAAEYGFIAGAEKSVIGSMTRLGEKITVEARLIDIAKREIIFTDRFSTTSIEDLDIALRKVAEALASQKQITSEVTRYAITDDETQDARRKKSYIISGASFGFGFPTGDSYADVNRLQTLAWTMRIEAGKFLVDNTIGISWGSGGDKTFEDVEGTTIYLKEERKVGIIPWDIGLRYLFDYKSDFSPYIGGGLGLHLVMASELEQESGTDYEYVKGDAAMAMHIAAGITAFQTYDFRLSIDGKYTYLMTDAFVGAGDSQQFSISISILRKFEKGEKRGCMSGGCIF